MFNLKCLFNAYDESLYYLRSKYKVKNKSSHDYVFIIAIDHYVNYI